MSNIEETPLFLLGLDTEESVKEIRKAAFKRIADFGLTGEDALIRECNRFLQAANPERYNQPTN